MLTKHKKHHGVVVPMITPLTAQSELDEGALRQVIDHLIAGGVQGILAAGTNGEGPSMSWKIRRRLMEVCVEQSAGRIHIYAGLGHCCMSEATEAACEYLRLGVDVIAAHLPFYFSLDPAEQLEFYRRFAGKISGPLMLYNIPGTTGMCIPLEVIGQLREAGNVVGIKDSSRDVERLGELFSRYKNDADFSMFSGASTLSAEALRLGADGIIASTSNVTPRLCSDLYLASCNKDHKEAEKLQERLSEINDFYLGGRPVSKSVSLLKVAMSLKGLCNPNVLPPLVEPSKEDRERVRKEMIEFGLL